MQSLFGNNHLRYAEYGLLVVIIGLLALFFLNRMQALYKNAERMAIIGEINSLRAGVVSMLNLPEDVGKKDLSDMNPIRLLQAPPPGYLGAIRNPQKRIIPAGSWYFRPDQGVLVYKTRFDHELPFTRKPVHRLRLDLKTPDGLKRESQYGIIVCNPDICLTHEHQSR